MLEELIEDVRLVHVSLKSEYPFDINDYYADIMDKCRSFLSRSGGSAIPQDFPMIDIIETRPIFTIANTRSVIGPNKQIVKLKQIGNGSYAKVFSYYDSFYNCSFAVKRALENLRPDELERFKNEFNDLKTLDSPFIIKAYRYDDEKNEYIMELANDNLDDFILKRHNNSIPLKVRRVLVIQLLKAFEYIHSEGFLHRDISCTNILVKSYQDGQAWLKVSDFGLVKRPDSKLTRQGTKIKGVLNDITDLTSVGFENYEIRHETYALGQVIYFIITGRTTNYHREKNPALKSFILRAISPTKEERFVSVEEMKIELLSKVFPSLS
ncbi:protein kinase domain-containing protein [Paenibacillus contaminans]|uniref:protein kinase domain-containing protein n=1 Tax=Paenibacillus contaminans TaxID=450362 RepID=UPI001EE0198F|nr:protein kinase [Paenibacillus contaminans]